MAGGRPAAYTPDNAEIARLPCMLGATNQTLAQRFGICRRTIDNWMVTTPEFSNAIQRGRQVADETVISALFARACTIAGPSSYARTVRSRAEVDYAGNGRRRCAGTSTRR